MTTKPLSLLFFSFPFSLSVSLTISFPLPSFSFSRPIYVFLSLFAFVSHTVCFSASCLSYDLFLYEKKIAQDGYRFPLEELPLDQLDGPHLTLGSLVAFTPFDNLDDFKHYLARLRAIPAFLDQTTALLKRGIELRWVQPRGPLRSVPDQIRGQLVGDVTTSQYFGPFKKFPATIPAEEQRHLWQSRTDGGAFGAPVSASAAARARLVTEAVHIGSQMLPFDP